MQRGCCKEGGGERAVHNEGSVERVEGETKIKIKIKITRSVCLRYPAGRNVWSKLEGLVISAARAKFALSLFVSRRFELLLLLNNHVLFEDHVRGL